MRISSPIFTGIIYSFVSLAVLALLTAFMLFVTGIQEQSMSFYVYAIHALCLLVGGFATGRKAGNKGWYYGGILGIVYSLAILITGLLGFNSGFNPTTIAFISLCFATGAMGGMFGINAKK